MSSSLRNKLVSLAALTVAATSALGAAPASAAAPSVASIAMSQVGNDCSPYNSMGACSHAWCADFARWVWGQAGADNTSVLNAAAASFYTYGKQYGTFHTTAPQVGDAVLYDNDGSVADGEANHVNLVVKVSADGTKIQTVGGNESRGVRYRDWFDWKTNTNPLNAGRVMGFISPKGVVDTTEADEPAPVSAVGDLTGDGKPDLLARADSGSGTLWIYPGAGNGHFGARIDNGSWSGMERVSGVGDVTGDGRADVAAVEKSTGKLWIYPGQTNGHLGARVDNSGGWGDIRITGSKDLNGDGRGDLLAVEESTGKLWMYPGQANGHFGARVQAGTSWDEMTPVGSAGDLTGDGRNDVAAVEDATGKLFVYPGLGNGQLGARVQAGTGGWDEMTSISGAGDYTGDGKDDLIAREGNGKLWIYPGQDNGQLGARIDNGGGWNFTA
ncbi:FG-GAP-like repeat-containing protein [Streptomyces sp. NPDC089919]|uniref:FG-GAP-like repeat-containing protein n=1 Tax=Streptomyces sp. NPDC089919 TaxID=3155188 RepID=UPI00342C8F69